MPTDPTTDPTADPILELASDGDLIHQLTIQATTPRPLNVTTGTELFAAVVPPGWRFATLDLTTCGLGFEPRAKEGGPTLTDVASFANYCTDQAEHAVDGKATFYFTAPASPGAAGVVTAVFDDHTGYLAGHAAHQARLVLTHSRAFTELAASDLGYFTGREFATWIEDHQEWIADPALADVLDLVRQFKATKFTTIEDRYDEASGDVLLHYQTETQAVGDLHVPEAFRFQVPIFDGQAPSTLTGRFRYDVDGDRPRFGYRLVALDAAVEQAQAVLLDELAAALNLPLSGDTMIRRGTPPSTR